MDNIVYKKINLKKNIKSIEWDHVEPMLKKGVSAKDYIQTCTVKDLREAIENKFYELWFFKNTNTGGEFAMTTSVSYFPLVKMLEINYAGGSSAKNLFQFAFDLAKKRGKELNCNNVRAVGRPGWLRAIKDKKITMTLWDVKL
jgi:hypothetical protein